MRIVIRWLAGVTVARPSPVNSMDRGGVAGHTRIMSESHHTVDGRRARDQVGSFLLAEPVRRNTLVTSLDRMTAPSDPSTGHVWWVTDGDEVAAVALHADGWPRAMVAAVSTAAVEPLVDIVYATTSELPEVGGEVGVAARFAGAWTERSGGGAEPVGGERLYELGRLSPPTGVSGVGRRATEADVATLAAWHRRFCDDVGVHPWPDPDKTMAARVAERGVWVWDDDQLVAMASATWPVAGASRIAQVYTPNENRGSGYGAAVTAAATGDRLSEGAEHCLLLTQLANATSNGIYRRLGYRAVEERLVYRLSPPPR